MDPALAAEEMRCNGKGNLEGDCSLVPCAHRICYEA